LDFSYSKSAARKAHPDKGGTEEKMASVNEAYEVLSKPGKCYLRLRETSGMFIHLMKQTFDNDSTTERIPTIRNPVAATHSSSKVEETHSYSSKTVGHLEDKVVVEVSNSSSRMEAERNTNCLEISIYSTYINVLPDISLRLATGNAPSGAFGG
jgi:curved DNA-binding protein CbpA